MKLVNVEDLKVLVAVESKGEIRYGKLVTDLFDDIPTVDAVPIELYEQVKGERDVAVEQLKSLNIELFEKPYRKAIPIEWLHSIMEKQLIFAMESEMEGTTTVQDGVIHCVSGALACQVLANVIELWKKENE